MLFSWLRSSPRTRCVRPGGNAVRAGCRPTLQALEDRLVPATLGPSLWYFSPSTQATHLQVIVPSGVQSGSTFNVVVEAETSSNRVATGFTGAVTLASSDTSATGTGTAGAALAALPFSYTFTAQDQGIHVFQVNLRTTGAQAVAAAVSANTAITGMAVTTVNAPAALTQLVVVTPDVAAAGTASSVTVQALDASGHLLQNFTGTVTLATSDKAAKGLPATYTFTAADQGSHTFQVTFATANTGTASTTLKATAGSVTGQASFQVSNVDPATVVTHFAVRTMPAVVAGSSWTLIVQALNSSNQVVTGYTGKVTFSSSDMAAVLRSNGTVNGLPFSYTFTTADAGIHLFYVKFTTPGLQTLSVTDVNAHLTSSTQVQVSALPAYFASPYGVGYYGSYGWAGW